MQASLGRRRPAPPRRLRRQPLAPWASLLRRPRCCTPPPVAPTPLEDDGTVFRAGLLGTRDELKARYDSSQPYPHCVIQDLCNPDLLRKARRWGVCWALAV